MEAGSLLDLDSRQLPLTGPRTTVPIWVPATTVWSGLGSTVQQLEALRLLHVEAKAFLPVAVASLLRGGTLAASLAVYVACPTSTDTRVRHYLSVMREELYSQSRYWKAWLAQGDQGHLTADVLTDLKEKAARRETVLTAVASAQASRRIPKEERKLVTTRVVEWSLRHLWPDDDFLYRGSLERFNVMSGHVHGLSWPVLSSTHDRLDSNHPEILRLRTRYDPDLLALDLSVVLSLVRAAGAAFERGRRRPDGPSQPL